MGKVIIEGVEGQTAHGRRTEGKVEKGQWAREHRRPHAASSQPRLAVAIVCEGEELASFRSDLEKAVKDYCQLVPPEEAKFLLVLESEQGTTRIRLENQYGRCLKGPMEYFRASEVIQYLKWLERCLRLSAYGEPNPKFGIELELLRLQVERGPDGKPRDAKVVGKLEGPVSVGERIGYRFKTDSDCFVLIFEINRERPDEVEIWFPNKWHPRARVQGNEWITFPDRKNRQVRTVKPPAGLYLVYAIATKSEEFRELISRGTVAEDIEDTLSEQPLSDFGLYQLSLEIIGPSSQEERSNGQ